MGASTFNIGVVIGVTIGKGYFNAFEKASDKANRLNRAINQTNTQLHAVSEMIKYREQLSYFMHVPKQPSTKARSGRE